MVTYKITDWLRETRKSYRINLSQLGDMTDSTHATLSRIESHKIELTLFSTVRIMRALGLRLDGLFNRGFIKEGLPFPSFSEDFYDRLPSFRADMLMSIDKDGFFETGKTEAVVLHLLKMFIRKMRPTLETEKIERLARYAYAMLNNPEAKDSQMESLFPDVNFYYPEGFSGRMLESLYRTQNALTLIDLGKYVHSIREKREMSVKYLADALEVSPLFVLNFEVRPAYKVKMEDIIQLDNALDLEGKLVLFAWRVAELYLGVFRRMPKGQAVKPWDANQIKVIEKLITAVRLFQRYLPEDNEWIDWYENGLVGVLPAKQ